MKQKVLRIIKSDRTKLAVILGLAFYIAFIPHQDYPYPVHLDEWVHMSFANELAAEGSLDINEPFTGIPIQFENKLEFGFQLPLGVFQQFTGVPWNFIFRFFPSLIFMVTVFLVYLFARKEGYGWQAALLACLVPTTIGILGPAFLVPVAVGLLFLPLMLYLAFNYRNWWSYLLLFICTGFLMSMHGPSIVSIVIILFPYLIFNIRKEPGHSLKLAFALFLPFLIALPFIYDFASSLFSSFFTKQPPVSDHYEFSFLTDYGYLPVILALVGIIGLIRRGGIRNISLAGGMMLFFGMLAVFQTLGYGIPSLYLRGLLFGTLMLGIAGGAGLREISKIRLRDELDAMIGHPHVTEHLGRVLCVIAIAVTLAVTIPARQSEPYYQTIDKTDYDAFFWIGENIGEEYDKAILDPWKATAFAAITGKRVYTRTHLGPSDIGAQTQDFLRGGSTDTGLMVENGLTIVYTRIYDGFQNMEFPPDNPDLEQAAENVYLLK